MAAPQWAKGALEGGLRRRSFRCSVSRLRSNRSADRAGCRPILRRRPTLQISPHLDRPPARMRPPHRRAALDNLVRNRLQLMQRRPRRLCKPSKLSLLLGTGQAICTQPSGSRKSAGIATQTTPRTSQPHPLIHGTALQPSHRQGPPCRPVDLLPMSPVSGVTYVAG
jgi:hypothetical protein